MMDRLRALIPRATEADEAEHEEELSISPSLRLFSAKLLVSSGLNATLQLRRGTREPHPDPLVPGEPLADEPTPVAWIPLLLGSAAGAAQTAAVLRPGDPRRRAATRFLSGAVMGMGAAGAARGAVRLLRGEAHSSAAFAPLLFGYTGLLSFLLDRHEREVAERRADLARRARIVERFVPKRRTRIEKIVVHV